MISTPARAYPGPGHAVLMTLALLGLQFLFGVVFGLAHALSHGVGGLSAQAVRIPPLGLVVINLIAFAIVLGWAAVANKGRCGSVWRGRGIGLAGGLAGVVAVVGVFLVVQTAGAILERLLPVPRSMADLFAELMDVGAHPFASILAIVAVPAVAEEWLFRGYILRGLLDHLRAPAAIALSTVLFALMHANLWQLPIGAGLGLLCGYAYLRTRSLGLCIALHAVNNSLALALSHVPEGWGAFAAGADAMPPWWVLLAGPVLLGGGVWGMAIATRCNLVPPELTAIGPREMAGDLDGRP